MYALVWFVLSQTAWGSRVYAVGNNPEATRLSGIRTDRLLIGVYGSAGLIYGITALLLVARTQAGDPNAGQTDNLESITAVVLGGTSLFGGRGNG
jgi:fructose transport system permease protein